MVGPARENVVIERAPAALQPSQDAGSRRFKQLELYGPACLLLHHDRTHSDLAAADEVADANLDYVAASQLAIDGKVEERPVTEPSFTVEPEPYRPHLLRLQCPFGADHLSGIPGS